MKKFPLGLLIAIATFFCGVLTSKLFLYDPKPIPVLVEEVKIAEPKPYLIVDEPQKKIEKTPVSEEDFDNKHIYGWYSLDKYYKGMKEVWGISLTRTDSLRDGTPSKKLMSYAGVFTTFENYGDQGFIDSIWAEVTEKGVKFRTNKIKGLEYRFKGTFFKAKTFGEEGEKVLRGTLQKFVKGKKVAQVSGDFAYYEPHCWH